MRVPWLILLTPVVLGAAEGRLCLRIVERPSGADAVLLPARIHLTGPEGRPVTTPAESRGEGIDSRRPAPFFRDHHSCEGQIEWTLPAGIYTYVVERGPEYRKASGTAEVTGGGSTQRTVTLQRWIDLAARGWWSGDIHVHRALEDMPTLMRSEDLHVAPVLTVWNRSNSWSGKTLPRALLVEVEPTRVFHLLACEDERRGGALMYFNLSRAPDLSRDGPEFPSPVAHLNRIVEQKGVHVDIEKPFWWDAPTWAATGQIDSIGLANNHMCRAGMLEDEAWGRPRDTLKLPPPRGNGLYTQEIYYRLLDCGFRIPPSAGSASGVLPNPLGYNRAYVHLDGPFRHDAWWQGLEAGRSFVTNGPVLLVEANGRLPGSVFHGPVGEPVRVVLDILVDGNDPIEKVEVIKNGEVVRNLPDRHSDELRGQWLRPTPLRFSKSGWFLVRAIAEVPETFRFASSAPFYVEVGDDPRRVHREDVGYFLEWIEARIRRLRASEELEDAEKREAVLEPHRNARRRFEELLQEAE